MQNFVFKSFLTNALNGARNAVFIKPAITQLRYQTSVIGLKNDYNLISKKLGLLTIGLTNKFYSNRSNKTKLELELSEVENQYNHILHLKSANTPFNIFHKEHFEKISLDDPDLSRSEKNNIISNTWNSLSDNSKKVYFDLAKQKEEEIDLEMELFKMNLGEEVFKHVEESLKQKKTAFNETKLKSDRERFNIPKRPFSGFLLFYHKLDKGDLSQKDIIKFASEKWNKLPKEEKDKYLSESKILFDEYKKSIAEWEQKMISEGHKNLVRKSTLEEFKKKPKNKKAKKVIDDDDD